jgi:glycosyltransferase involved in cell wall biosynthesis
MKLLYISERADGSGAAVACSNLAIDMKNSGHEVLLLLGENSPHHLDSQIKTKQVSDWRTYYRNWSKYSRSRNLDNSANYLKLLSGHYLQSARAIEEAVNDFKPDAIHLHNVTSMLRYSDIEELSSKYNVIWTAHARHPFQQFHNEFEIEGELVRIYDKPGTYAADQLRFLDFKKSAHSVTFISPSDWLADIGKLALNGSKHKVHKVPNLIPDVVDNVSILELKSHLDVDFLFLSVIIDPTYSLKNFQWAENVFYDVSARLKAQGKSSALFVTTPMNMKLEFKGIFTIHSISDHDLGIDYSSTELLSSEDLAKIYRESDFTIISSLAENMPNAAIESLASGTPVVSRNVGGMQEFTDGNGVIRSDSEAECSLAMVEYLSSQPKLNDLRNSARKTYEESYSPHIVRKNLLKIYSKEI